MTKILLTTTSYQDTPGAHHALLESSGFDVVRARGPLTEQDMLDLVNADGPFDGFLHGDDHITARVIDAALPELKVMAKYGIGLDALLPRAKSNGYEYGIHVPLAIRWGNNSSKGKVVDEPVGFVDLSATIVEAAGLEQRRGSGEGRGSGFPAEHRGQSLDAARLRR